jgi:hypothetical protein
VLRRISDRLEQVATHATNNQQPTSPVDAARKVLSEIQDASLTEGLLRVWDTTTTNNNSTNTNKHAPPPTFTWNSRCQQLLEKRDAAGKALKDIKNAVTTNDTSCDSSNELQQQQRREWRRCHRRLRQQISSQRRSDWQHFCSTIGPSTTSTEVWSRVKRAAKASVAQGWWTGC